MATYRVTVTDTRKPPKFEPVEFEIEAPTIGEAIEAGNSRFFTEHQGERHDDFDARATLK